MLLPPQQYEIKKIAEFENIDRLLDFAVEHNKVGVQMILPVCKIHSFPNINYKIKDCESFFYYFIAINIFLGKCSTAGWYDACFTWRFYVSKGI